MAAPVAASACPPTVIVPRIIRMPGIDEEAQEKILDPPLRASTAGSIGRLYRRKAKEMGGGMNRPTRY
jgi:hypothetical protein